MLTKTTVEQSSLLTQDILAYDRAVVPKTGSMLAELVDATIPLQMVTDIAEDALGSFVSERFVDHTRGSLDEPSSHTRLMRHYVELLSSGVQSHIKLAKEVVLPIVKETAEELVNYKRTLDEYDAITDINIIMYRKPALASSSVLLDMVDNYTGVKPIVPTFITLGEKSIEEIMLLCTTGANSIDNELISYLNTADSNLLSMGYELFFNYGKADYNTQEYLDKLSGYELFPMALLGYLCSRRLYDNVPENVEMSLSAYRNRMSSIRDYCGAMLVKAIERMDSYDKNETIIVGLDNSNKTIRVNDRLYKLWLKEHNEEAILGAIVSGRPRFTMSLLLRDKERLVEEWNNYRTYHNLNSSRNNIRNMKSYLSHLIYNKLSIDMTDNKDTSIVKDSFTEIEKTYMVSNKDHPVCVKKNIDAYVESLTPGQLEDLPAVALHAVAKCRFYFTSAYTILSAMEEAAKINPDIHPREAALISVISYVTDYLVSQVKLEAVDGSDVNGFGLV